MKINQLHAALCALLLILAAGCNNATTPGAGTDASSESEATVEAPDVDLHAAVLAGNTDAVRQHIRAGSDLDEPDPFGGSSPLISAATFGMVEIARLLIDAGADLDFTNRDGSTALHSAAFFCRADIVDALLAAGADKTIVNKYGSTAYDTVSGSFDQAKPIYDVLGQSLAPIGLTLDYEHLRATRPQIASALR